MTIKQNGGVFGRNPTFNDVTIEGDLILNGETFTGLDFNGSWNASTNSPSLSSGTGTQGEFYIVSVAGTTSLDGIANWDVGDYCFFNGSAWQRIEGGADGNFVNVSISGQLSTSSPGTSNLRLGVNAGNSIISGGSRNTLVGHEAGTAITDNHDNTPVGYQELAADTTGFKSTAVGRGALATQNYSGATDSYNVAVGHFAGNAVTTGTQNTLIGGQAGDALTVAFNNVAMGYAALVMI